MGGNQDQALDGARARARISALLAYLGAAFLRTDGLPAFSETLKVAAHWLDTYWPQVYPLVDEDAIGAAERAELLRRSDGGRRSGCGGCRSSRAGSTAGSACATSIWRPVRSSRPRTRSRPDEAPINAAFAEMPLEELTGCSSRPPPRHWRRSSSIDAKMRERGRTGGGARASIRLSAQLAQIEPHVARAAGAALGGNGGASGRRWRDAGRPGAVPVGSIRVAPGRDPRAGRGGRLSSGGTSRRARSR